MAAHTRSFPEALLGTTLLAVLVGVPLVIAPGVSFHFDVTPKVVVLLLGAAGGLLLWNGYLPGLRYLWKHRPSRLFCLLLLAQLVSLALSTILSGSPELSVAGSHWRRLGLVTHASLLVFAAMLMGWLMAAPQRLRLLLRVMTAGAVAPALYGTLQYFGIDPFLAREAYHVGGPGWDIVRPPGTLGHAGYFTIYLLHAVFFALGLARADTGRGWRWFGFAVAALGSLAILLSGTRSALLGLLIGAVVVWAWNRPRVGRRAILAAAAVTVAAGLFYYSPAGRRLRTRTDWYADDVRGGVRLWLWGDSLAMGAQNWAHGTGPETFSPEFPRYQTVATARAYPNRYNESPHNAYLDARSDRSGNSWALGSLDDYGSSHRVQSSGEGQESVRRLCGGGVRRGTGRQSVFLLDCAHGALLLCLGRHSRGIFSRRGRRRRFSPHFDFAAAKALVAQPGGELAARGRVRHVRLPARLGGPEVGRG